MYKVKVRVYLQVAVPGTQGLIDPRGHKAGLGGRESGTVEPELPGETQAAAAGPWVQKTELHEEEPDQQLRAQLP